MLYTTGGLNQFYPSIPFISETVTIGGASTRMVTLVTPVLTLILVVALVFLINHTKVGMAMRAVSKDFETSRLMGIKINTVISITFVIGSFLAAVGSVLYFTNYNTVIQTSGNMPGLKAFVAAVFGGIARCRALWWARLSSASAKTCSRAWIPSWSRRVSPRAHVRLHDFFRTRSRLRC